MDREGYEWQVECVVLIGRILCDRTEVLVLHCTGCLPRASAISSTGSDVFFQQDNARPHSAAMTQRALRGVLLAKWIAVIVNKRDGLDSLTSP